MYKRFDQTGKDWKYDTTMWRSNLNGTKKLQKEIIDFKFWKHI